MNSNLPPLPNDVFDGNKESVEVSEVRCTHKNTVLNGNELRCACGAVWTGMAVVELKKILDKR